MGDPTPEQVAATVNRWPIEPPGAGDEPLRAQPAPAPAPEPPPAEPPAADHEDDSESRSVTTLDTQRQRLADLDAPVHLDYQIPKPYSVTAAGVFKHHVKQTRTGEIVENVEQVASAPCLVAGVLTDDDGEELVELVWRHYRTWRRRAIPRAITRSGRRLVTVLGDAGFPVMDGTARKMELWLDAVEAANRDHLPVTRIARTLGWQPSGTFVTSDGQPYPVHLRITGMEPAVAAHHPQGGLEDWQAVIKALEPYPVAQMGLYAAWAAPLLRLLRLDSFTVDFSGLTTTGKTTALEAGLSVWADPHNGMAQWNATRIAIENRLAIVDGIVVAVDETSAAEKAETIRDLLYTIPRNRGKDRGTLDGSRPALGFHTVMLASGERSILSFTKDGGTAARVLEITGAPFGTDGGEVARDLREGVYACYGTAGPAFAAKLGEALDADGQRNIVIAHREARAAFATGTALNRRRAPLLAALWTAASLARQWRLLPFDPPQAPVWREIFDRPELADDRPGEALQVSRNWLAANQARIWGSTSVQIDLTTGNIRPPLQGWAGCVESDGGFALIPEVVREVLARAGYELDAVKGAWADSGAIRRQGRDLTRKRVIDGASSRLFVFTPETDRDGDDGDAARGDAATA